MELPSTRKTLPAWSKSCRSQKDGWDLDHVMDKERLRNWRLFEITPRVKDWSPGPRPVGGISVSGLLHYLSKQSREDMIWLEMSDHGLG